MTVVAKLNTRVESVENATIAITADAFVKKTRTRIVECMVVIEAPASLVTVGNTTRAEYNE
jgi:hypothetical protein